MHPARYWRRKKAGEYLKSTYGFGSERSLAKLACVGGGPPFCKVGPMVLYEPHELDTWAQSKIGEPRRSTSDATDEARRLVREEAPKLDHWAANKIGVPQCSFADDQLRDHHAEPSGARPP
jgi:hypothetical protein